jgi:hypothetical protein
MMRKTTEKPTHSDTFTSYAEHNARMKSEASRSIEQNVVAAALERCREFAQQICVGLRDKRPSDLDIMALAEFQVEMERAAAVLTSSSHDAAA